MGLGRGLSGRTDETRVMMTGGETGEQDLEELLGELAEVVRRAGREFQEMLAAEALPTAGNA